ncbi:hypothetical protein SAMN06265377_3562 [Flagellimonas pacifica]|uniref:Uncharacterized protein n=1 Tax=Flagellimonas pacifica TaxID=1247520 RepID=A0A285MWZ1_9FLAO|nr:hypothetical protein SAMN06265377_3562 [Allomuricauda parva]
MFPITLLVGRCPEKDKKKPSAKKKLGMELNLLVWGTGIPCNNKRAHARVVSHLLIVSLQKITSFQTKTPSESFKCF